MVTAEITHNSKNWTCQCPQSMQEKFDIMTFLEAWITLAAIQRLEGSLQLSTHNIEGWLKPNSQWVLQKLSRLGQEKCSNYRDARFRITYRLTRWSNTVIHTGSKHQSHLFSSHTTIYVYLVKHGHRIQMCTDIHKNHSKTLDLVTDNTDIFKPPPPQEITTH